MTMRDQIVVALTREQSAIIHALLRQAIRECGDMGQLDVLCTTIDQIEQSETGEEDLGPDPLGDWHGRNE